VVIRPAAGADARSIAPILNAFVSTTTIEWTETPQAEDRILEWLEEHDTVLVVEDQGEVVGVAASGWFRDIVRRPGYRFTVENTIHVREDRWRSGVGRKLMGALIDAARASGKHTMVAAIDGANEASIRFHERLGFVEVARMPELGAKLGRWQDLVLLQLRLDDRSAPGTAERLLVVRPTRFDRRVDELLSRSRETDQARCSCAASVMGTPPFGREGGHAGRPGRRTIELPGDSLCSANGQNLELEGGQGRANTFAVAAAERHEAVWNWFSGGPPLGPEPVGVSPDHST